LSIICDDDDSPIVHRDRKYIIHVVKLTFSSGESTGDKGLYLRIASASTPRSTLNESDPSAFLTVILAVILRGDIYEARLEARSLDRAWFSEFRPNILSLEWGYVSMSTMST
jgi:hypothetical protein